MRPCIQLKVAQIKEFCLRKKGGRGTRLGVSPVWYQGIVKATVSGVFEDPKFKVSESSDQN